MLIPLPPSLLTLVASSPLTLVASPAPPPLTLVRCRHTVHAHLISPPLLSLAEFTTLHMSECSRVLFLL